MARQCWANAQGSRPECLDAIGILSEVEADVLEEKAVNIFEKLGCNVPSKKVRQSSLSFHDGRTANKVSL